MKITKNKAIKWLRIIHRDLGFLMVGISLVYGISGMVLNHMGKTDPAFATIEESIELPKGLSHEGFTEEWEKLDIATVKQLITIDAEHSRVMLNGGIGVYNSATGLVDYELHRRREFVYWINRLHYSRVNGWNVMADIFAISLIFFALSGIFMVKGRKGVKGRGKWYLLVGVLIPLIFVMLA